MSSVAYIGNILRRHMAFLVVILALALAVACGGSSEDAVPHGCAGLETVVDRTGLIGRGEAEELTVEQLGMSAPEVTGVEVEGIVASCPTTLGSYEQDLRLRDVWTNPAVRPNDMPVWIVEVKGLSRPAGISVANANNPYRYAMEVIHAKTGESIGGSRYQEALLEPTKEE